MIVTKTVGLVDDVETENPNGAFEVILSAATLDRDGEVIDSRAFDPLPDHVPFDIDHGMTVTTTVGSGTPYYAEDGTLRVKGTYASTALAQEVRTLVCEGHVRTTSVTFMAAEREKDAKGVPHVTKAELLNGTFTPVPSNRESVVLSAKSFEALTDIKATAKEKAGLQSVHDALVGLGATCDVKSHAADERDAKSADDVESDVPETTDTEVKSADEAALDSAAVEAAESDAAKSADEVAEMKARTAVIENAARIAFGG